jgi:hypothetical protein
VVHVRNG